MIKVVVFGLAVMAAVPAQAGGRWDAITSGRIYDRMLTPQLNPSFAFADERARRLYLQDLAEGRIKPPQKGARVHLFDFRRH